MVSAKTVSKFKVTDGGLIKKSKVERLAELWDNGFLFGFFLGLVLGFVILY